MEHISETMQNLQVKVKGPNESLTTYSGIPQLTTRENEFIALAQVAKQFGKLNPNELLIEVKKLLVKIHVITGWVIPASEMMVILADQVAKKLTEDYADLNPEEVEHAFRSGGTTTEDWGKAMNLNLLDKILIPYSNERHEIFSLASKMTEVKPTQRISTQAELDNFAREDAQRQYVMFTKGLEVKGLEMNKIILVQDGLMREDETVLDFFKRRAANGHTDIYRKG